MSPTTKDLLATLQQVVEAEPQREDAARTQASHNLARRFPLVHRTVGPGGPTLSEIVEAARIEAREPCTVREKECGIEKAAYYFLGCAAFPQGSVAFVVHGEVLDELGCSYTPFDTGSLTRFARPQDPTAPWEEADKKAFLEVHLAFCARARTFAAAYVAAHFDEPRSYVTLPQVPSVPDWPAYHGLKSKSSDRRAWSIEVQLHEDLPLEPERLASIVLAEKDLLEELPASLFGSARDAGPSGDVIEVVQSYILGDNVGP